jgi:hypothetical protein
MALGIAPPVHAIVLEAGLLVIGSTTQIGLGAASRAD